MTHGIVAGEVILASESTMLNLCREHTKSCTRNHRARLHTRKAQESPSLGWKKCGCPIYASGTLKDGFLRKNTGYTTWEEAERQATQWEQAGTWSDPVPSTPTPTRAVESATPSQAEPAGGTGTAAGPNLTTIEDAVTAFIAKCERRGIQTSTYQKYKTFTNQFRTYCDGKGYVTTRQLKVGDGELFYATWQDGPRAAGRKLERFRRMVRFWKKQAWIEHDLGVFDIEPPIGANEPADQFPYTDDELDRFYTACDEIGERQWINQIGSHVWSGQDVKHFIILSIWTGLRISDLALFDVKESLKVSPDAADVFIKAKKNGKRLYTWVPDAVRDMLLERQAKYGDKIFQLGESDRLDTVTDLWRRKQS
jgi:integrase